MTNLLDEFENLSDKIIPSTDSLMKLLIQPKEDARQYTLR